jgi:Phosphodiester glycosidase
VRVDLTAPGIGLYVTPLDPAALARGWQYRLQRIEDVVRREHLAVAINGTMFRSESGWWPRMAGDLACSVQTVVVDHVVNRVSGYMHLLWFDDQLTPHLRQWTPSTAAELASAKWGIGGQAVPLWNGQVWPGSNHGLNSYTAVSVDEKRRLLFLAVGEHISPRLLFRRLADLGAKNGILLDGGGSSAMAIGQGAEGVPAGILYGGARPVATYFGVRARVWGAGAAQSGLSRPLFCAYWFRPFQNDSRSVGVACGAVALACR